MGLFHKKFKRLKNREVNAAVQAMNLLLNDKIDQMVVLDTLVTILIQRGVFTKEEFDQIKGAVKSTKQYHEIYKLADQLVEDLNPDLVRVKLTDGEIEELAEYFSTRNLPHDSTAESEKRKEKNE